MRGKVVLLFRSAFLQGITPAYAGKRFVELPLRLSAWDHPRICGEKHGQCLYRLILLRITPAYAGKRLLNLFLMLNGRDHPRICGEKR